MRVRRSIEPRSRFRRWARAGRIGMLAAVLVGIVSVAAVSEASISNAGVQEPKAPAKPITPEAAADRVGQSCTVEMRIRSARRGDTPICFLNSEADFRDKKNFTAVIFAEGLTKFKKQGIEVPESYFEGKLVRITGKVEKYRGRPQIRVDEPKQIEIVKEPDGAAPPRNP